MSTVESSDPSTSHNLPTVVAVAGEPEASTSLTRSTNAARKSWKERLDRKQLGRILTKSTAVYCVLIVGVWIFHAIPIVAFYSSAPQVGQKCAIYNFINGSMCMGVKFYCTAWAFFTINYCAHTTLLHMHNL